MAKASARRRVAEGPADSADSAVPSAQDQQERSRILWEDKELRLSIRFSRGKARLRWEEAKHRRREGLPKNADTAGDVPWAQPGPVKRDDAIPRRFDRIARSVSEQTGMTPSAAEKALRVANDEYSSRKLEPLSYADMDSSFKPEGESNYELLERVYFYKKIVDAMATGTALHLQPHEIPRADLPPDVRERLAAKWEADIADLAAGRVPTQPSAADDLHHPPLPTKAPERYRDRPRDTSTGRLETITAFLKRVWKTPWIDAGVLTRTEFRRLDPEGEMALRNWLRNPDNRLPDGLQIPTKAEVNDRQLEEANPDHLQDAARLLRARTRREGGTRRE